MEYQQSSAKRHHLLLAASTMAAHASADNKGFRQRDVRRMIEFSASWAYPEFDVGGIPVDNTQIRRYIERLVTDGLAKKITRGKQPRYRLTRLGFMELVSSIVNVGFYYNKDEFFYLYFIVRDYRYGLQRIIEREGTKLSYALRLEIETLLDSKAVVENQLFHAKRELKKLNRRMQEQDDLAAFVNQALEESLPYEKLIEEVDLRFPFCFNSAFPLSQLTKNISPRQTIWELTVGSLRRKDHIWKQSSEALQLHIQQLECLFEEEEQLRAKQVQK